MIALSAHLILIAVAGLIAFVLLMLAALGASRSRKSDDPNDDPRCGACGCIVGNPTDLTCRTCGSPLAAVGMVLPFSKKRTPSRAGRQAFYRVSAFPLALWTILIVGLAIGGTYGADQYLLPYVWQTTSTVHARPRSRGCESIVITTLEEYHARGRVQLESPSATRTSRLEIKTESGSHLLHVDLLGTTFIYADATGKPITQNRLPTKSDVLAFMQASGVPLSGAASHEASIIAGMLSNYAPQQTAVISSRDSRVASASTLDTAQISFSGGQWKEALPLKTLAMYSGSALWLLGFIMIILLQRKRRAKVVATILAPPAPAPSLDDTAIGQDEGGWEIIVDAEPPFRSVQSQSPSTPARLTSKSSPQTVILKKA